MGPQKDLVVRRNKLVFSCGPSAFFVDQVCSVLVLWSKFGPLVDILGTAIGHGEPPYSAALSKVISEHHFQVNLKEDYCRFAEL